MDNPVFFVLWASEVTRSGPAVQYPPDPWYVKYIVMAGFVAMIAFIIWIEQGSPDAVARRAKKALRKHRVERRRKEQSR